MQSLKTATRDNFFIVTLNNLKQLTKIRLSLSVVFSSIAGYLLGATQIHFTTMIMLGLGGYFVVGASNAYNQIIERDLDALMKRTKNRPLPSGKISVKLAFWIATLMTLTGIAMLYTINPITAMFGAISVFLYTCVYTPLKTITPLSVFVGAFPGAIPFMLGWIAATGSFGVEAATLFIIQFFWQFPHFWAIGWVLDDDYKKAGFKLLPTGKKDKTAILQAIIYTIWMIIVSVIPVFKITGDFYIYTTTALVIGFLGLIMLYFSIRLYQLKTNKAARRLMLASVTYISLVQMIYVIDKFAH